MVAMHNAPIAELPERTCFLSLLAEASLEHHIATKRADPEPPSLVCAEASIEAVESVACAEVTEVAEKMAPAASAPRPRSTSPPMGKAYSCKFCGRGYANTDAARKHARQQHPEWLKAQGIGCPAFYCTPMEAPSSNTATGTISPPAKAAKVDVVMATKASPPSWPWHAETKTKSSGGWPSSKLVPAPRISWRCVTANGSRLDRKSVV